MAETDNKNEKRVAKSHLTCPFCEEEIAEAAFPYCEACKVELRRCPKCLTAVERDATICPQCGASLQDK